MSSTVYKCEGCGGILEFDAKSQSLMCPHCGNAKEIESEKNTIVEHSLSLDARRTITVKDKVSHTLECSGCGAFIEVEGNETAKICPFCGSSYVLSDKQEDVIIPDGVVPFKIDERDAHERFNNWMKKRLLAPNELKNLYQRGGFQSVYIPYWTFDAQANFSYTGEGGKDRRVSRRGPDGKTKYETVTDWYHTSGHIDHFFDDVQVPASKTFKGGLFKGVEPFNLKQLSPYSPSYLSGHLSENYSISLENGHVEAVNIMRSEVSNMAERKILTRYDRARSVRINGSLSGETYKYILIPVYSTTYDYKSKRYHVVINGQTGKVSGDYPYSVVKIILIALLVVALFVAIMYLSN